VNVHIITPYYIKHMACMCVRVCMCVCVCVYVCVYVCVRLGSGRREREV